MILDSEEQRSSLLAVIRGSQVQGPMVQAKQQMEFLMNLEQAVVNAKVEDKGLK
jgi:hypothetical protein